jgi:hypothetical protein
MLSIPRKCLSARIGKEVEFEYVKILARSEDYLHVYVPRYLP